MWSSLILLFTLCANLFGESNERLHKSGVWKTHRHMNVHVGPMWFSHVRNEAPQLGDPITVVGFRISFDKKPDIIAREIELNGKKITVWEKSLPVSQRESASGDKK